MIVLTFWLLRMLAGWCSSAHYDNFQSFAKSIATIYKKLYLLG